MPGHIHFPEVTSPEEYAKSLKEMKNNSPAVTSTGMLQPGSLPVEATVDAPKEESIFAQFESEFPALQNHFHDPEAVKEPPEAADAPQVPERKSKLDSFLEKAREKRKMKAEAQNEARALDEGHGSGVLSAERIWDAEITQDTWSEASIPERKAMLEKSLSVFTDAMGVDPMIRDRLKLEIRDVNEANCSIFSRLGPDKAFALDMTTFPTITFPEHLCTNLDPVPVLKELYRQAALVHVQSQCITPFKLFPVDSWMDELAQAGAWSQRKAISRFADNCAESFAHQYEHRIKSDLMGFSPTRHDVYPLPLYKED